MKIKKLKTLNEAIEEIIDDGTYSVMDHNLASSVKREAESKEKAIELFDDKIKESALEDRDAHSKVSTPVLKKMHLSESLFEEYEEKSLNESLYNDILKEFPELKGKETKLKAILDGTGTQLASAANKNNCKNFFNRLEDFFPELKDDGGVASPSNTQNQSNTAKYTSPSGLTPEEYADLEAKGELPFQKVTKIFPELSESINGNTSHAQDFVSALRSAGFGDGFDQKLKIDTYGNGGTRVEYKDQGGTFTVIITDDRVVLEGQDEGDAPFKKEFSTWEEFASEFESLYPGIPVRENKILVEDQDIVLDEASYTRSDNKKMLVKPNRDPLVDVIQLTLTDGEWGYVKSPDGTVTPSLLPHLSYPTDEVGVSFDNEGRYFVRVWDVSEESLQKVAEVAKQFNREYKIGFDKYTAGSKKWYCLIYLNEDTDFDDPYVDPEAEVNKEGIKGRGTKLRGNPEARHARDNEDLEDSQRYPIESPAPAQTGLREDYEDNDWALPTTIKTNIGEVEVEDWDFSWADDGEVVIFIRNPEVELTLSSEDIGGEDGFLPISYQHFVDNESDITEVYLDAKTQELILKEIEEIQQQYEIDESLNEDISVNGSLMEDKISIDMIHDFKPQEGAAEETFNRVLEAGKMETLEFALEDRFPDGVTTEELNKVLSDEAQWIYNQLGMKEFIIPDEDEE